MKDLKKIIAIVMVFVLLISTFTACTKNKNTEPSAETSSESVIESTDDENTSESTAAEDESSTTEGESTDASSTTSTTNKPETTTKKNYTTTTTKQNNTTTTRPANNTTTTTTTQASGDTYATFKASTGETIRYTKYRSDVGVTVTKVEETNGVIYFYRDDNTVGEQPKCSECGKYLCTGCVTEDYSAPCKYCGRTDCIRYVSDVTCPACHQFIPAYTCHHCTADC